MQYRISFIFTAILCLLCTLPCAAQEVETINGDEPTPVVLYSAPKKYVIGGIAVEGVTNYEDYVLIGLSGLSVGQEIVIPGDDITQAIRRYWKHGLFSDVQILADKFVGNEVFLRIILTQRPRISEIRFTGVKKSERQDLENRLGIIKGSQITPNQTDRAKSIIKRYFDDKGFKNAEVVIVQRDDPSLENQVIVNINIDKKEKVKVNEITIAGNEALKTAKIKRLMKKTNEKGKLQNIFRTKKFVPENFEADKERIIEKYNELGYRDAQIIKDSVVNHNNKTVDIFLEFEEGQKYFLRNVSWVGNTLYSSEQLDHVLHMKSGDVYNQKMLNERLNTDDDAVGNLYYNNGYLFYSLDPVEINIVGDSIDLEMRIYEGAQATINKVTISGNDRLYENVVRRELRTRPGDLFSREDLMRSLREIQQMGHFDPENIQPDIQPDPTNGTVDIGYDLISKANDQIEFSAGWGQTGVIGKLSLKFTNFSLSNLLRPGENYRGILPQGEGQTLTLSAQTNAKYYQSYSVSFFDPWFGGKRPNSFSVSAFYSRQSDISSRYYGSSYMNNIYNGAYTSDMYDSSKNMQMYGVAVGWGKRLRWPDDYFTLSAELSLQRYSMNNWVYFPVTNGNCNNVSINITLGRSSIDYPIFPRSGSEVSVSVQFTPPYSLFDGVDYKRYNRNDQTDLNKIHKWIEYHKWKFKSKTYTALSATKKPLVVMTRVEFGLLGHYNRYKRSPFETFDVGGDGMTGASSYATESVALRGYENSALTPNSTNMGYAYSRLGLELRYPIMLEPSTSIYVAAFAEGGNAWNNINKFNPFDIKRSAGFGVRIFLPMIGMMGIDWAYGFDKVFGSKQYGGSQLHFILGQEF